MSDAEVERMRENVRAQHEFHRRAVENMIARTVPSLAKVHIHLLGAPTVDEYGQVTFAEWGGWLLQVQAMAFWDNLVLTPKVAPGVYDFGWIYHRHDHSAYLAALRWNPEVEGEPKDFVRAIAYRARRPGERASEGWE